MVDEINEELTLSLDGERRCRTSLEQHEALIHTAETKEEILAALSELDGKLTVADRQTGALTQALRENDARKEQQGSLQTDIAAQRVETLRWAELSTLIGSSSGDTFARFAQTISLEQLLCFANEHLRRLSERYQLCCNAENPEDLKLMVHDSHLAGCTRDTKTLSGGESFLVSLGLALGLAEMASQSTRIDSLFIDEGFGTLDDGALDDAITTLEGLQERGKKIGVISHVEQLKERIQTQLVVTKCGNGYSRVEVISAE